MGIGASVFLLAAGAILTFALDLQVSGIDLDVVGWILMGAGAIGLIVTLIVWGRRREFVTSGPAEYRTVDERRDVRPPDAL